MSGWKDAWEAVAGELSLAIEKADLFGRPTLLVGLVADVPIRIEHFAQHGDDKAKVTATFMAGGPPSGLVAKRRTSGHWKMAPQLHPRHRRVGLWELWANEVDELDEWLTEEREQVILHLDPVADLSTTQLTTVVGQAVDAESVVRTARRLATEAGQLS